MILIIFQWLSFTLKIHSLDKQDYATVLEPTLLTLNSPVSEISKFAKINETIIDSFPNSCLDYSTDSIRIVSTCVPHFSVFTQDSTFVESDTNFHCYQSMNLSNEVSIIEYDVLVNYTTNYWLKLMT